MMKYGVVAVLVTVLLIACETTPSTTAPSAPTSVGQVSSTDVPSLIEQLAPTPTATPIPPSASFSVDVESGSAPLTVNFSNVSNGPITLREWDFGDGTTSTEQSPSHRYTLADTFTVGLKVVGPGGTDTAQISGLVTVSPGSPFSLEVSPTEAILAVQEETLFTTVARDQFGNVVKTTPEWVVMAGGGSIDADGRFTADTRAGSFTHAISAYVPTGLGILEAASSVTVEPGPVSEVLIEPDAVTLDIGATQTFSFTVLDEHGNKINDALSSWSSDSGDIDANGVYTSGTKAGQFGDGIRLDVVKSTDRASATVDVVIPLGPLGTIEIQPSFAVLDRGEG